MPLSEHEQRMLEQIESALYAEDPKFASSVRGSRIHAVTSRRRLQAAVLFVLGLVLLVAGVALPVRPGGFPVISLVGFVVMFGAGILLLLGSGAGKPAPAPGNSATRARAQRNKQSGFAARMEDRFRRRFEQE